METKRQQFERETGINTSRSQATFCTEYVKWLEKQLEVRAISDEDIDIIGNKRTDLENVGERIAFKKGMLALRDMNDRANGWISVKDRLPEDYQPVVVFNGEVTDNVTFIEEDAEFRFHNNGYDYDAYTVENVTHWMPLPSPPNE